MAPDEPQSTPCGSQLRFAPPGSHLRPMLSAGPVYWPVPSAPSRVGAEPAGMAVLGTTDIVRSSVPVPAGVLNVVLMSRLTFVFWAFEPPEPGRVSFVYVLLTVKVTVCSAPGASGPYGFEAASVVIWAGSGSPLSPVMETLPLCGASEWLCTTTGTSTLSPTPTDCTASERPRRLACGAVSSSQLSYSSQRPQRSRRPSAGATILTTSSV